MLRNPLPPPSNPASRLIDQTIEASLSHGVKDQREAEEDARALFKGDGPTESGHHR